jgi:glutathione synthase/RimK-type ligase-like ATP-grasp enzyme
VLVQRFVAGVDVRVHVVGRACFATEVRSAAVDYRFDDAPVEYESVALPPEIAGLCERAAAADGLELAGLDFRRAPDGTWWCLEMNPVPTFLPYEAATGQPIGDAILDHVLGIERDARTSPLSALVR